MNLWESLGFKRNPYDARWLEVSEDSRQLFVGRQREASRYLTNVSGVSEGGIVIVEGDVGVGKTSFVNVMQHTCYDGREKTAPRLLPTFEPIEPRSPIDIIQILVSVLSNGINSLVRLYGKKEVEKDRIFKKVKQITSHLVHTTSSVQAGIQILGTGASVGRQKAKAQTSPISTSLPPILETMDRWIDRCRSKFDLDGFSIPIDNLDTIDDVDVMTLFNQMRDLAVRRRNFWWTFIAGTGTFSNLETRSPRVSELVTGLPVFLSPLSWSEIQEAIEKRLKWASTTRSPIPPVSEKTIKLLYEISKGEIRFLFKRITDLILEFKARYPGESTIGHEESVAMLRNIAMEKLKATRITKSETKILKEMANAKSFRPKDFERFGLKSPQSLNKYLKRFMNLQLVQRTKKGRASIYRPSGDVILVFG